MNPSFSIGSFQIYYYGLIIASAVIIAFFYTRYRSKKYQVSVSIIDTALILVVPLAILGARLYYILFNLEYYLKNPLEIIFMREGGLAIHGALLGGALGLFFVWLIYCKKYKGLSYLILLDLIAPALLIGQIIGRVANFINQEAFGMPTNLPWGIYIELSNRPYKYLAFSHFHPTFAYEMLWNLIILLVILWLEKKWLKNKHITHGKVFAFYILGYSFGRFWLEYLRTDALMLGNFRVAQFISLLAFLGSLAYFWYCYSHKRAHNVR